MIEKYGLHCFQMRTTVDQKILFVGFENMVDIPEALIIALTLLLVVLWTRHWLLHHYDDRKTPKDSPRALSDEFGTMRTK
jgi:hypothetical protein